MLRFLFCILCFCPLSRSIGLFSLGSIAKCGTPCCYWCMATKSLNWRHQFVARKILFLWHCTVVLQVALKRKSHPFPYPPCACMLQKECWKKENDRLANTRGPCENFPDTWMVSFGQELGKRCLHLRTNEILSGKNLALPWRSPSRHDQGENPPMSFRSLRTVGLLSRHSLGPRPQVWQNGEFACRFLGQIRGLIRFVLFATFQGRGLGWTWQDQILQAKTTTILKWKSTESTHFQLCGIFCCCTKVANCPTSIITGVFAGTLCLTIWTGLKEFVCPPRLQSPGGPTVRVVYYDRVIDVDRNLILIGLITSERTGFLCFLTAGWNKRFLDYLSQIM